MIVKGNAVIRRGWNPVLPLAVLTCAVHAQDYPAKPIRMLNPLPAGGPTDILGRMIGKIMSEDLKQPILIDNRPGANGIIAADAVAKAAPDGHMLWMGTMVQLSNDLLNRKMPFDPVKDLIPVIGLVESGSMFVSSMQFPARNLQELIAAEKPDIVHARSRAPAWSAYYASAYYALGNTPKGVGNNVTKDFFYYDASYIRLRNISLGVDFARIAKKSWLKKTQVVLSGRNLMTWTKYDGMDPEISSGAANSSFDRGVDHSTIPNMKTVQLTLNLGF